MPELTNSIMAALYGRDIWQGFEPIFSADLQGWNGDHPSLKRLTTLNGPALIVDVGVWKGMSTINMAIAMREAGLDGCIIAVDTFLGSPEHWDSPLFTRRNGLPDLYEIFLSNVIKAGVHEYVVPMPQTASTAAMILAQKHIRPSLVHIDAAHEYEDVLRDARTFFDILQPGGYMIGDDYHPSWPGVVKAAGQFSFENTLALQIEPPKWIVQKP